MQNPKRDTLATDMLVTFDQDEMEDFFDGFASMEEIVESLFLPLGNPLD